MIIQSLKLDHFRNYEELSLDFDAGTNIFYGDNAQGKTNILEAIYVSATTKSHKTAKDREMIQFESDESHIRSLIEKKQNLFQIDMHLKKNRSKGIAINKVPIRKASELFGILNIVFFSPEDLNMIKNGPSERRRFMDLELCQLDKIYLDHLTKYNRILNQRNHLLKDINVSPNLEDTLSVWDTQLLSYGKKIINCRSQYVDSISPIVSEIHLQISGGREQLQMNYEPNISEECFETELKKARNRDKKTGQTTVGPHRDDLSFFVHGVDLRKFGSQGQQRTLALSLKLSEIELIRKLTKDTPVLLLDDVLSELDSSRQTYLLHHIQNIQTMITCTGLDEFINNRFHINRVFQVVNGQVFVK